MEWKEEQVKMQTLVIGLNKKPGFTLIELLIVIVIIGLDVINTSFEYQYC